jgi:Trk K+ transport system NAD-binding subunit
LGVSLGHIDKETMGLITLVGVVTIFASTYMILYSSSLYKLLSKPLKIFEMRNPYREAAIDFVQATSTVDIILLGLGNYGTGLADCLLRRGKTIIGVDFDPAALEKWRSRGISVLYGEMADPEIHEQLPLRKAGWVVSTVRSRELNLTLLNLLKTRGYQGKVALTATNEEEAGEFQRSGAHVVFRPFSDAAEQAADALSHAMGALPDKIDWPIAFREIRVQAGAKYAGKRIRNIPLRSETGVSILAVSRAGHVHHEPESTFRVFPGDRLILMGSPEELRKAESLLNVRTEVPEAGESDDHFEIAEIRVGTNSERAGKTLAELQFRQAYGVTVVGIKRGETRITSPKPSERLEGGDTLVIIGSARAIEMLKKDEPLLKKA